MESQDLKTIKSQIIYESPLLKRGKYQNTFKEKWFVLLQNHILVYYSSEEKAQLENGTCDGTINLKEVNNFSVISSPSTKSNLQLPISSYLRVQQARKSSVIDAIRVSSLSLSNNNATDTKESDSFAMQLDTPTRSYIFGSRSSTDFKQWLFLLENMIFGGIIHSGYLMKQGGKWKSWKKRWFTLDKKLLLLKYYETEKLKIWKGAIDLAVVTNLCCGDKESNAKDFSIELHTNERVWVLSADDEKTRDVWIDKLKNVIDSIDTKPTNAINIPQATEQKQDIPTTKGVRFGPASTSTSSVPKRKGVRFAEALPQTITMTRQRSKGAYNLDDNVIEESVTSVSSDVELSDISRDYSTIIHDEKTSSAFEITQHNKTHSRLRTTISVLIQPTRSDSDELYYDDSDSELQSLDEYDGSLASGLCSTPGPHDEDASVSSPKWKFPTKPDHIMPDFDMEHSGRFGDTSQISVERWGPQISASVSPLPPLTEELQLHRKQMQSKGYLFKGLKSQFINVHDIDLKTNNDEWEDKTESEDDSSEESLTRVRRNTLSMYEDDHKEPTHMKTRSVMRTVEFDERFRKIYRKKKKNMDLKTKEQTMNKRWKELMKNGMSEDQLKHEWNEKSNEMISDNCLARVAILVQFYHFWIYNSKHKQGISEHMGKLSGFNLVSLLNDFHHIKRDYGKQSVYLKLFFLQQTNIANVDIESCIMLLRCNRDKVKMSSDFLLRRSLYFLSSTGVKGEDETRELVLQQLLDSIYCFIFYGEYFSSNDSTNLCDTINIYEKKKWKNVLYKYKNEQNVAQGNKFCSSIKYENELANSYGGNKNNIFGVNMRYGTRIEWYYLHRYKAYFSTMKEELMNHFNYEISTFQWNDMMLKADKMKKTLFLRSGLLSKKPNENYRKSKLVENRSILDVHIIALLFYSHFNKLKKSLLDSYHILCTPPVQHNEFIDQTDKDKDDIQSYTRLKHYTRFYHFGRLILESVVVFGDNMYSIDDAYSTFYAAVNINYQSVVSWNKFAYNTYGPLSVTRQAVVSFLYNDNYQSTILELDLNGGTLFSQYVYCIDVSFMSDCPYEYELILDGGVSLGIRNILSLKLYKNSNDYYKWMESIFLLRIIIGDIYWKLNENMDQYFIENLSKNEMICTRLASLIVNEMEFDADDTDSSGDIPKHVRKLFHSYCDSLVGYCYVDYSRILYLPKKLQHLFLVNEYECINCQFMIELFPNINFIYGYNFIFDSTFCKHIVNYLSDEKLRKNRLMYIQFEKFDRQKQINTNYFKEEILNVIEPFTDNLLGNKWNIKKSRKWECIKFENKELIDKYTILKNPLKLSTNKVNKEDDEKGKTIKT